MFRKTLVAVLVFLIFTNSISTALAEESEDFSRETETSTITELQLDPLTNPENLPNPDSVTTQPGTDTIETTPPVILNAVKKNIEDRKPVEGNNFKLQADTATGALVMDYPIRVPPGRNGLQPDLSLSYNSQNSDNDNLFGYGWSINIPYIERLNKKGTDKLYNENFFASSLSGELASISLTDGTHGSYGAKVENENFLKYEYKNNNSWEVSDKTGLVYKFGLTSQSRQDDPGNSAKIYKWMLEEIRDTNDNFIKYEYSKEEGQIYPSKIKYTGNGSTDGPFSVEFITQTRSDRNISSKTGFRTVNKYLISKIKKNYADNSSQYYEFSYTTGDNGIRSTLQKIVESGSETLSGTATEYALPPDQFEYQKNSGSWQFYNYGSIPVDLWNANSELSGTRIFDVNGDSLQDLVFSREGSPPAVYINKPDAQGWQADPNYSVPLFFVDQNGKDLGVRIGDVNGDDLSDLLYSSDKTQAKGVYLNKADGTGWQLDSKIFLPATFVNAYNEDVGSRLADVNGDGLVDIINNSLVFLNNAGTGWGLNPEYFLNKVPVGLGDTGTAIADVNGDGLADVLYSKEGSPRSVYLNTGKDWQKENSYSIPVDFAKANGADNGVRMDDANGDGLLDIFYARADDFDNRKVYINKGDNSGWKENPQYSIPEPFIDSQSEDNGVRLADVDGDGLVDFLFRHGNNQNLNKIYLHSGTLSDLLNETTNKNKGTTSVYYKSSGEFYDYQKKLYNPKLPFLLPLVDSISEYDGGISSISIFTNYIYFDGQFYYNNALDRRFAGFGKIIQKDSSNNSIETYFHQGNGNNSTTFEQNDQAANIGRAYRIDRTDITYNLYNRIWQYWDNTELGNGRNFSRIATKTAVDYDSNQSSRARMEQYIYDTSNGNLQQKFLLGEIKTTPEGKYAGDIGNDSMNVVIDYAQDTSNKIQLPSTVTFSENSGKLIQKSRNFYDGLESGNASKGNLTKQSFWVSGDKYASSSKSYNSYGLITEESDPLGNKTSYEYDSYSLYPVKITNALNQSESYAYDYSSGAVKQYIDFNGSKFETIYDIFDRTKEIKHQDPTNSSNMVINTQFDYYDNTFPRYFTEWKKLDGKVGPVSYSYIDGLGRVVQTREEIEDPSIFSVRDFKYNYRGLLESESLPYLSSGGSKTAATSNENLYIKYEYDSIGRIKKVQNAAGTSSYSYDNWKTTIMDAENNQKDYHHDAHGNLVMVVEYNENKSYTTHYQYNGLNQLVQLTDAMGNIQTFGYDGLGRRTAVQALHSASDSTFGIFSFTYDDAGNLTGKTDGNGQIINYGYDKLNRLTSEDFTAQVGTETAYQYDNCSIGRLCQATEGNISMFYSYNLLGQPISEKLKLEDKEYSSQFSYDFQNNILSIVHPDSTKTSYSRNMEGKIKSIKHNDGSIIKNINYSATGVPEKIEFANNTSSVNQFDINKLYRLNKKNLTTLKPDSSGILTSFQIHGLSYTYDKVGNITKIVDASTNPNSSSPAPIAKTADYQYDNLYRLKTASISQAGNGQNYEQQFAYNALGNITSKTGQGSYAYDGDKGDSYATPHALTTAGNATFNYDKNGNLLSDGKHSYKWDHKNRLIEASGSGFATKYLYSHTGERIKKSDGKNWAIYINKFYEIRNDKIIKNIYAGEINVASIEVTPATTPSPPPTPPPVPPPVPADETVYEDAEDGKTLGWKAYAKTSSVVNSYENEKQGKVITLKNSSKSAGFKLLKDNGQKWNNVTHKFFNLDLNSKNNVQIALIIKTNSGDKYLEYSSLVAKSMEKNTYIYIKLNSDLLDGNWHTITRDLQADISSISPGTKLEKIYSLQVWWSGKLDSIKLDNIKLMKSLSGTAPPSVNPPSKTPPDGAPSSPTTKTIYHHTDHLSGTSIETDENGNVIEMTDYYPFGEIRVDQSFTPAEGGSISASGSQSGTQSGTSASTIYKNPYKFTGKELDTDTGLYYYGARYYNPAIGSFVSMDPWDGDLKDPQSLNRYSYVRNNPLRYVDPTGAFWETPWDIGVTAYDGLRTAKNLIESAGDGVGLLWNIYVEKNDKNIIYYANSYDNNFEEMKESGTDLSVDVGATMIPFVPAGVSKVSRTVDKINEVKKTTSIWTKGPFKSGAENAYKHWKIHGSDFQEIINAKQYVEEAKKFLKNPPKGSLKFTRNNGDKMIYDVKTNTFGVMNKGGSPKTFFKPTSGLKYFFKQKKK